MSPTWHAETQFATGLCHCSVVFQELGKLELGWLRPPCSSVFAVIILCSLDGLMGILSGLQLATSEVVSKVKRLFEM